MRLRGVYLLSAAAASVAAILTFAGPAAASNLHCGQVLNSSVTLIGNLDCSTTTGPAIVIGHDGVTLNLNGFAITGHDHSPVIQNFTTPDDTAYDGTTIKGGTLNVGLAGTGVENTFGGNNLTVAGVTIAGSAAGYGVFNCVEGSSGLTVSGGSISGVATGVCLASTKGALVKGNTITPTADGFGVEEDYGTADVISGNTFTNASPQTGDALLTTFSAGTVFSGNTVTAMEAGVVDAEYSAGLTITGNVFGGPTPAGGNDIGIYLYIYGSGDIISGNYIRNSVEYGVFDVESFNNTYVGNVLTSDGSMSNGVGFLIAPTGYGPVTMVNNIARLGHGVGYDIDEAYSASVPGGPYSLLSGNSAIANGTNGAAGFEDIYSVGATWSKNSANWNASDGFLFCAPWRETITGNSANLNGADGYDFLYDCDGFVDTPENEQPLAVTNNVATNNGEFGFEGEYPTAGTGNTGSNTNVYGDCYLVAGCS